MIVDVMVMVVVVACLWRGGRKSMRVRWQSHGAVNLVCVLPTPHPSVPRPSPEAADGEKDLALAD